MNIYVASKYIQLGYRIKRTDGKYFLDQREIQFVKLSLKDLLAEDWEVIVQGIIQEFPIIYQE
jgi:hypothetical protein